MCENLSSQHQRFCQALSFSSHWNQILLISRFFYLPLASCSSSLWRDSPISFKMASVKLLATQEGTNRCPCSFLFPLPLQIKFSASSVCLFFALPPYLLPFVQLQTHACHRFNLSSSYLFYFLIILFFLHFSHSCLCLLSNVFLFSSMYVSFIWYFY